MSESTLGYSKGLGVTAHCAMGGRGEMGNSKFNTRKIAWAKLKGNLNI